jgi:small subunit ribosomal protein S4
MGSPKKQRKKYHGPSHMWQKVRLDEERPLKKEYALSNKNEIWKMGSFIKKAAMQAKKLIAEQSEQAEKEKSLLLQKLKRLGLLRPDATIEDCLGITLKDVLERRLQTLIYRKNLAKSTKQARQFIVHRHIKIGSKIVTSPSHIVSVEEELQIGFSENSALADQAHPEREVKKP